MSSLKEAIAFLAKDAETNKFMHSVLACYAIRSSSTPLVQGLSRAGTIHQLVETIVKKPDELIKEVILSLRQYSFLNEETK